MNTELLELQGDLDRNELYRMLWRDPLTNAYNRRAFELQEHNCMALVDMDSLKYLNDNLGHRVGDVHLAQLADELGCVAGSENVYRISGDEFVVSGHTNPNRLTYQLTKLREGLPGFSFGIGHSLEQADEALARDKQRREQEGTRAPRGERPPWLKRNVTREYYVDAYPAAEAQERKRG